MDRKKSRAKLDIWLKVKDIYAPYPLFSQCFCVNTFKVFILPNAFEIR